MKNSKIYGIAVGSLITALYIIFTLIANTFGLSNGIIQIRISEALCILPCFTPYAIPALFAGCLISNIITGAMALDIVFGSIATLIGAAGTYYFRKNKYIASLPPVISNSVIIPFILSYVYKFEGSIFYFMLTVCAGEIISCGILGIILYNFIKKHNLIK